MRGALQVSLDADQAELSETRRWLRAAHARARQVQSARPFLVITPLGLPNRPEIRDWLAREGVQVTGRHHIPDWPRVSTAVYARTDDDERLLVARAFERAWRAGCVDAAAERWDLGGDDDIERVRGFKSALRSTLDTVPVRMASAALRLSTGDGLAHLRAVHVPDRAHVDMESRLLDALAKCA
ncbi:MAG: hypothetical protein ABMA15_16240 [Vicinamibacterales bacterium]